MQGINDYSRNQRERQEREIALLKNQIADLKLRIDSASLTLQSANLTHANARSEAHRVLTGQNMTPEQFRERFLMYYGNFNE